VVEDDEGVGDGEEGLGHTQVVGRGGGELLQVADGVVGEEPDRAADEGREIRERGDALLAHDPGEPSERVGRRHLAHPIGVDHRVDAVAVRERPLRIESHKRVATEALGGLGALQQKDRVLLGEAQDGRDRGLQIPDELGVERDHVVGAGELSRLSDGG
jgi:hypothetical protein